MKPAWIDAYPPGVPARIDARAFSSLKHLVEASCARFSNHAAFSSMGARMSYRQLDRLSRSFAAYLQKGCGLARGARVAIMMPNLLQYPVALFGALRAGLTVVNVNPLYTADEVAHQLRDSGAAAIVILENFAHTLESALPNTVVRSVIVTRVGDLLPPPKRIAVNFAVKYLKRLVPYWSIRNAVRFQAALARGERLALDPVPVGPEDLAFLQYTGGTTGRPKGAMLTHGNLVANVEQTAAWIRVRLHEGEETVITALPLYHVFALTANLLVFVKLGGCNALIANPRDIPGFIAALKRTRFTAITGVDTLYNALLDAKGFAAVRQANGDALKVAVAGGMSVRRAVAERWQEATGVPLIEGYGLTEASPIVCANRLDIRGYTGRIGFPVPSTEVAILDEHGAELPTGATGEIGVRGPQVMRGYWNAPEETAAAFTPDGWLRTGDLGRMDAQGAVEFVDRIKDMIVVSGFKAYPAEIEDVAVQHPGVKDAGAVGVPDEHSGEAVALFVVRRDPSLTARDVLDHCAKHLTRYKRPKHVAFRDALPKTPIGKVLRRQLRDELAASQAAHETADERE